MEFTLQDRFAVENRVFDDVCEGTINPSEGFMMLFITRQCCLKKTDSVELSCGFLSKRLNLTKCYVTKIEKSLEEKGYITVTHNSKAKLNLPNTITIFKGSILNEGTIQNRGTILNEGSIQKDTTIQNDGSSSIQNEGRGSIQNRPHNKTIEDNTEDKLVYSNTTGSYSDNDSGESQVIDEDSIFVYEEDMFGRKLLTEKSLNDMLGKLRSLSGEEYYDFYTQCQEELGKHGTPKLWKAWNDSPKAMNSDSDESITSNDEEVGSVLTDDELTNIINQIKSDEVSFVEAKERVSLHGNDKQLKRLFAETL